MNLLVMTEEKWAEALHDATVNVANGMMSGPVFKRIRAAMTKVDLDEMASDWLTDCVVGDCFHDIGGLIQEMSFSDYLLSHIEDEDAAQV